MWVGEGHQGAEDVGSTIAKCQEGDAMGERVKAGQCRGPSLPRPFLGPPPVSQPPCLPPPARAQDPLKDTATLWDSLSVVEIADKFGQKLRGKSKW